MSKQAVYRPIYARPPNKVRGYKAYDFEDRSGNSGEVTEVLYEDGKGKIHSLVIRVKWRNKL